MSDRSALTSLREPLREKGWLSGCPKPLQDKIFERARVQEVQAGVELYRVGDYGDAIYGLIAGAVDLDFPADNGETFTLHRSDPGYWIGDLAILSKAPRLITLKAASDCVFLKLSAASVKKLISEDETALSEFYRLSHENTKLALRLIASLLQKSSQKAVAMRLLIHAEAAGLGEWMQISQSDIAAFAGVSLATAKRILADLTADKVIETAYGRIKVLDPASLERLCKA